VGARRKTGGTVRSTLGVVVATLCLSLALTTDAFAASQPVAPYDGANPFRCKLQNAGTGTDFSDPGADPFCVEYDKTQQNVTDLGLVEFLSLEPARVAAASPKCFYHQTDHWTGSVVQGEPPELWHWDGRYFFDKARGQGGVFVENFRVGGQTADPTLLTGFPEEYRPYFGPGGGGVMVALGAGEPSCAAKVDTAAEARRVYRPGWR
jgi:hypothetical protein